ncbi:hypothetical protein GE09DRAFT_1064116 [Coniochaeta sp. 2T2.1]|nr:hypothetical protein GE09DRAFT_1064116 [Coniochaeta sp. 2T2.1]
MSSPARDGVAGGHRTMLGSRTAPTNPKTDPNQKSTKKKTADEKPKLPLEGCVINYAGFFGPKYPRSKLREMFEELGAESDIMEGEEIGAHIVSVEWLKDCHALKQRMDEEDYYFDEPPDVMHFYSSNQEKCLTRPYQHLLEDEEDDLEVVEDENQETPDVEETEQLGSQAMEVDENATLEE